MNVLLVQCPCSYGIEMPQLSLAYLSSCLKMHSYNVSILDLSIKLYNYIDEENRKYWDSNNGFCWYLTDIFKTLPFITEQLYDEFVKIILSYQCDIIGFSIQNTSAIFTLEIIKRIKLKDHSKIIILGGPNCYNISGEDSNFRLHHDLQNFADVVVVGEGEETLVEVVSRIRASKPLDKCRGIAIPLKKSWYFNGFAGPIKHLNELPFPDFQAYNLTEYKNTYSLPILTSRGCIMKCVFCTDTHFWSPYRYRSAKNVMSEITHLYKEYKIRFVSFNDSLINGNCKNFFNLCNLLIGSKLDIRWGGNCRVDRRLNPRFLRKMRKAGCEYLILGIESASNKILRLMHKGFTIEEVGHFIYDCHEVGINIEANWVVGFPGETEEDFMATADFITKHEGLIKRNIFSTLTINQFSYLNNHKEEFGIILNGTHLGLWYSDDGRNTIELRSSRMRYLENIEQKRNKDYGTVRQIEEV